MASKIEDQSFLFGSNTGFIEWVYGRYLEDPNSVDPQWAQFFAGFGDDVAEALGEIQGASWAPRDGWTAPGADDETGEAPAPTAPISVPAELVGRRTPPWRKK